MFQAGVVAPSSPFLLQLLTPPANDLETPPLIDFSEYVSEIEGLPRPLTACEAWCDAWWEVAEPASLELLMPRGRPYLAAEKPPVFCGLMMPVLPLSPAIALVNLFGCTAWALRLNADIHCST